MLYLHNRQEVPGTYRLKASLYPLLAACVSVSRQIDFKALH